MKEILVIGNCEVDFKRLGINPKLTYSSECSHYMVCEVTEEEFKILCDEQDIEGTWSDSGWRHCDGSTKGITSDTLKVNGEDLKCWYEPLVDENDWYDEWEEDYKPSYDFLEEYLCHECGASTFKNICALTTDLAKYNNMKLSELFKKYQG